MSENNYYIYIYFDSLKINSFKINDIIYNFTPFYVGKGKNKRDTNHLFPSIRLKVKTPFHDKLNKMLDKQNNKPIIKRIYENLNEEEAYILENKLTLQLGTVFNKKGPLLNMKEGGTGGTSPSKIIRNKISKKNKGRFVGEKNGNYKKGKLCIGNKNPFFGKKHNEKNKSKMRRKYLILYSNNEWEIIDNIQLYCKKYSHSLYNITGVANNKYLYKDIKIKKLSKNCNKKELKESIDFLKTISKEKVWITTKEKMSKSTKGKKLNYKHIHKNGIKKFIKSELLQQFLNDGWKLGNIFVKKFDEYGNIIKNSKLSNLATKRNKNSVWMNNGIINRYPQKEKVDELLKEGFVLGKIKKERQEEYNERKRYNQNKLF